VNLAATALSGAWTEFGRRILRTMTGVAERLTADAYLAREDPRKTELIDGVVVVSEPAVLHQQVRGKLYYELVSWTATSQGRGAVSLPLNVVLDEGNVLAPGATTSAASASSVGELLPAP
jgi:hypothetical protein